MRKRPRPLHFEALKAFCDVAQHRSFSQAARVNEVTQSAVSQSILHLEERLGVQLIDRSKRPLQLTPLGKKYYDGCKPLVEQYLELEAALHDAQAQVAATVRVAAIYSVGLRDLNHSVQHFEAEQPGVHVHIEYLHPNRVYAEVLEGVADFGLVSFPRKSRELTTLPWREEVMVLTCSPSHRLAHNLAVEPRHLSGEKYIGFDKGLVIRREVDRFLRGLDILVDVVLEFDNIENIKKAVEAGAGVALLPEPTVRREVQVGSLVALPLVGCGLVRPLGIIYRRHQQLSTTAQRFLSLLRQPDEVGPLPVPGDPRSRVETDEVRRPAVPTNGHRKAVTSNGEPTPSPEPRRPGRKKKV